MTVAVLELAGIRIAVVRKDIKNVHLTVHPPDGTVRITAPRRKSEDSIRLFAIAKLGWIRQQQRKLREQERETPREYLEREGHFVWGRRLLLKVVEADAAPSVRVRHSALILKVRPRTTATGRSDIVAGWYRGLIRDAAPTLIDRWSRRLGVSVSRFYVQHMKTRWGSCNPAAGTIRLNTELAKKPRECLEYIVVHELAHLLEPTHNAAFVAIMDRHLPTWRHTRDQLNRLPARHEEWVY